MIESAMSSLGTRIAYENGFGYAKGKVIRLSKNQFEIRVVNSEVKIYRFHYNLITAETTFIGRF